MHRRIKEGTAHENLRRSNRQPRIFGGHPLPLLRNAYTPSYTEENNMENETMQQPENGIQRSSQFDQSEPSRVRDMSQDKPHHRDSVAVASNQVKFAVHLEQDAESSGYQLRSNTSRDTNNQRRSSAVKEVIRVANVVPEPKQLANRKDFNLGGDELHENFSGSSLFDKQPKKRRASPSFYVLIPTKPRNARQTNSESVIRPAVTVPFSFLEEKWLFFHVTDLHPGQELKTVDWDKISAKFNARFKIGRNSDSLGEKWKEMMRRGVTMHFYEHGDDLSLKDSDTFIDSISTHSRFQNATARAFIPVPHTQSAEPQDSSALSTSPPRPASASHSVASSIPVTPLAIDEKPFTWTQAQEEWLLSTCLHAFTKRKLAFDWKQVAMGFRMTYGIIRPAAAFKDKWKQLKTLASTSEENAQGDN
ncbi:hypothetical protein RUND412_011587 [Rhizina undulata]